MTTPYIGSKISLISKLDIRYEGILFSVDPVQSTIALSQVQSFGTEDRPAPVPVPARPEIYEFIIFKASDIKDLIVCETPAKAPNMADDITYDPAIVSVSKPPEPQMQPIGEQQRQSDEKSQESPSPQQKHHPAAPPHYSPPPPPAVFAAPPPQPQSYRSAVTGGVGGGQQGGGLSGGFGQRMQRSYYNRGLGAQNQQQMPSANANYQYQQQQQQHQQQNRQYFPRNQQQQHEYQYQGQNRRGGGPPNRQPQQHNYRQMQQPPQRPRFDGDFDFEKANEQFQHTIGDIGEKLAAVGLNEERKLSSVQGSNNASARESEERSVSSDKVVAGSNNNKLSSNAPNKKGAENFYDKTKSFFDNISCDALEREEGKDNRIDWKKERITNQETFGQTAVHSMHFRRGGRGGGGGGGGYHRGYGGQQQYSQRPQYNNNGNNAFARQQPPQRQANY